MKRFFCVLLFVGCLLVFGACSFGEYVYNDYNCSVGEFFETHTEDSYFEIVGICENIANWFTETIPWAGEIFGYIAYGIVYVVCCIPFCIVQFFIWGVYGIIQLGLLLCEVLMVCCGWLADIFFWVGDSILDI